MKSSHRSSTSSLRPGHPQGAAAGMGIGGIGGMKRIEDEEALSMSSVFSKSSVGRLTGALF